MDLDLLAYFDSRHDFENLEKNNEINYLDYIKDRYIELYGNNSLIKELKKDELVYNYFINKSRNYEELDKINNQIILNFNLIFDIKINKKIIYNSLSDIEKIKLRQPLYFLIKTKDYKLINFFINYMNLIYLSDKKIEKLKKRILINLDNFDQKNNLTYPMTFFDDMTSGLNKIYFRYKIINYNKNIIDEAKVESLDSYFTNKIKGKNNRQIEINNSNTTITFDFNSNDSIKSLGYEYFVKDNKIIAKYKNLELKILKNSVGRSKDGLYHKVDKFYKFYNNKEDNDFDSFYKKNNMKDFIEYEGLKKISKEKNIMKHFVNLVFGSKRFGDWYQVYLSKKYYFILQTEDKLCFIYSLLIGAPVIFKYNNIFYISNYNISKEINLNELILINSKKDKYKINKEEDKLIFKGLKNHNVDLERFYFTKYLIYKSKYIKLKNLIYQ